MSVVSVVTAIPSRVPRKYVTRCASPNDGVGVTAPCSAYQDMCIRWELLHDLFAGTLGMREHAAKWLPSEPGEDPQAWQIRVGRSVLHNAYRDTIDKLASKPFSRAITLKEKELLPEPLELIEHDCDREGTSLTSFFLEVWEAASVHGLTHVLVDMPATSVPMTLADERSKGVRPYFTHIPASNLVGWQSITNDVGHRKLTQIRFWESMPENKGKYGDARRGQIRVITCDPNGGGGTFEVWRVEDNSDWVLVDSGVHDFKEIPLVTVYFNRSGYMTAEPPFEDLAWLNLAHFQSDSDQRNILRIVRVAPLAATGLSSEELKIPIVIGPRSALKSTNKDAKFYFVEHTGKSTEAGANDLKVLEERMEIMGLQPLVARSANDTATGKKINEGRSDSTVHRWVEMLEAAIDRCYDFAASHIGESALDEKFGADVFNDFAALMLGSTHGDLLTRIRKQGDITRKTFLYELKRRAILSDRIDPDEENEAVEAEAAESMRKAESLMGLIGDEDDEDEDDDDAGDDE